MKKRDSLEDQGLKGNLWYRYKDMVQVKMKGMV
jgi:hypothetical protein